jgi:histidyl-tRNA synthetase
VKEGLKIRGLAEFANIDVRIVRGLAYYTGIVFEVFDRAGKLRAIAGGGRYDNLVAQLSDGAASLAANGFAMGDVVLGELIRATSSARERMEKTIAADHPVQIYAVIAKEERRESALQQIQALRERGYRVEYPLIASKVPKQFQSAEQLGARFAVVFGDEWPQVAVKDLVSQTQQLVANDDLASHLESALR